MSKLTFKEQLKCTSYGLVGLFLPAWAIMHTFEPIIVFMGVSVAAVAGMCLAKDIYGK